MQKGKHYCENNELVECWLSSDTTWDLCVCGIQSVTEVSTGVQGRRALFVGERNEDRSVGDLRLTTCDQAPGLFLETWGRRFLSLLLPTHRNEVRRRREVTSPIQVHKASLFGLAFLRLVIRSVPVMSAPKLDRKVTGRLRIQQLLRLLSHHDAPSFCTSTWTRNENGRKPV